MRRGRWRPRSLRGFSLVRRVRAHSMDESLPLARALQTTADPVRVVQGHSAVTVLDGKSGSSPLPQAYHIVQTRGFFRPLATRIDTRVGSLPLPQAVRDGGQHAHLPGRVTPARAGATSGSVRSGSPPSMYSRSRGLHFGTIRTGWARSGAPESLPLARALSVQR
jgi:hypothetical protein